MPTLSTRPLPSQLVAPDSGLAVLAAVQAARDAASHVYRTAAIPGVPARAMPARGVLTLDLRLEEARQCFEEMAAGFPAAQRPHVSWEVETVRETFAKALAALTALRARAPRPVPDAVGIRFLSAQIYSAMAHIQATVGGIRRKLS